MNKIKKLLAIGLLASAPMIANAAPTFVNGNFETGNFTGWSTGGGPNVNTQCGGALADGSYYAWVGNYDASGSITQTVSGFTPGHVYRLDFLAASENSGTSDVVRLDLTGASTSYQEWNVAPANSCWDNWETKSLTFTANSSSITFHVYGYNQPYDVGVDRFVLTDVTPSAIPTLSDWSKVMLAGLLAIGAFFSLRRRFQ